MGVVFNFYPGIPSENRMGYWRRSALPIPQYFLGFWMDSWLWRGNVEENKNLQQTQLVGTRAGFGAALNLQFVKDLAVMPLDRVQGQKKPLADLPVRESLGNEL
jgi:hypothetical protein